MTFPKPTLKRVRSSTPREGDAALKIHPRIAQPVLRCIAASYTIEACPFETTKAARGLILRYGVAEARELEAIDPLHIVATAELAAMDLDQDVREAGRLPVEVLADEVSEALGLSPCEAALARLGFLAALDSDLRRALSLREPGLASDMADFFSQVLQIPEADVLEALEKRSILREEEMIHVMPGKPLAWVELPDTLLRLLRREQGNISVNQALSQFFLPAPPPELSLSDFDGQPELVDALKAFLQGALETGRAASNVLIHGAPGVGKTQLVRALAQHLECMLLEVPVMDADEDPLPPWRRVRGLMATQQVITTQRPTLVVFDEIEDVFPDSKGWLDSLFGTPRASDRCKGWLTRVMEGNPRPVLWLANRVEQIDPAYLRRFDLVLEMKGPGRNKRQSVVDALFDGLPLEPGDRSRLVEDSRLQLGHLEKLASAGRCLQSGDPANTPRHLGWIVEQTRKAFGENDRTTDLEVPRFRPECINCDVDLLALTDNLAVTPRLRLCLFGPPGTGKSAWSRHVAMRTGLALRTHRASDLLDKYVGESEKRIRHAFEEAADTGSVLMIDEADSLIGDRAGAAHRWEVSMTNELLIQLERFPGLCLVSTNAMDRTDPAAMRRFDLKIRFGWLRPSQSERLFMDLLEHLEVDVDPHVLSKLSQLDMLAPGDFAAVSRQARFLHAQPSAPSLLEALGKEMSFKPGAGRAHRVGFL